MHNLSSTSDELFWDLLGKEFQYGGRGPLYYDCYGLCVEIYRRRGLALWDFGSDQQAEVIHRIVLKGKEFFTEIVKPEPWCLVTFMVRPPYTSHVGVVLEDCVRFIHIMQKSKVTIERLDSIEWKRRIKNFLKVP